MSWVLGIGIGIICYLAFAILIGKFLRTISKSYKEEISDGQYTNQDDLSTDRG